MGLAGALLSMPAIAKQFVEPVLLPGDEGWFGPRWEYSADGGLLSSIEITSFPGDVEQWLQVTVFGLGVEYGWCVGPYSSQDAPFSLEIDLPVEANGPGLVQVFALLDVTDAETGDVRGHARTDAAYVSNAGQVGETWYDEATASARVVNNLAVALEAGDVLDGGLVGSEVSP
jgi:hypothetical protein